MLDRRRREQAVAVAEQKVGRHDPPDFLFQPLRIPVYSSVLGPGGLLRKILAIVAPVGYGKTVLMSMLLADLRRAGRRCIWLALDERDNGIDAIIGGLMPQLQASAAKVHPTQALFGGDEPAERRIDAIVERLNRQTLPLTIFIDNLQFCADPDLGRLLDSLCFGTRASVSLVFSSTRELPLNVSRALLEGLIRQIGPIELSFRPDEVAGLLGAELCGRLGEDGVAQVARQTEGWPAAARLAQIILSNSEQPRAALSSFKGSDESIAHLLNRQVLSGFTPAARAFLLTLGQLRSFCPELCREASGDPQAQQYLDDLIQRNIFVIPLDRNGQWYRLHSLFREFLLREGERGLDEAARLDVLRRAAHWCERNGYWREAVDYALDAKDYGEARDMLERIAAPFVRNQGDMRRYIEWIEALHRNAQIAGPEAEYWFIWALTFYRRYDDARQRARALAQRLDQPASDGDAPAQELHRRIAILEASIDCFSDRLPDAYAAAQRWLAGAGPADDAFDYTAAYCIETAYQATHYRFVEARRAAQSAREAAFQAQSGYADGWVSAYGALPSIYEGDYTSAYPELVVALDGARNQFGKPGGIGGTLALIAAKCAIEMGLDDEARELLRYGLESSRTHGFLEAAACGLEAAVELWTGDEDSLVSVAEMRRAAGAYAARLSRMLSCFLIRRQLVLGHQQAARDEAEKIGLSTRSAEARKQASELREHPEMRDLVIATELELMIDAGRGKAAATLIADELPRAREQNRVARIVELLLLQAQQAAAAGRTATVVRDLTQAVRLAAPRRIVRPFLRQARAVAAAIVETPSQHWAFATCEEQRFFAELCGRLPTAGTVTRELGGTAKPQLLATLTPRELELLKLIEAGLSNQQIADRLEVSLTTTKWHLQNLYGKLQVSSRSAALAAAKALNLLGR